MQLPCYEGPQYLVRTGIIIPLVSCDSILFTSYCCLLRCLVDCCRLHLGVMILSAIIIYNIIYVGGSSKIQTLSQLNFYWNWGLQQWKDSQVIKVMILSAIIIYNIIYVCGSSKIHEIEVYNNGKTHMLLKSVFFIYKCAGILLVYILSTGC